jgi:hypothetical protein
VAVTSPSVNDVVVGLRGLDIPSSKRATIRVDKSNVSKAFRAAQELEKSAAKPLLQAEKLAESRETFHRDLGAKFRLVTGDSPVIDVKS